MALGLYLKSCLWWLFLGFGIAWPAIVLSAPADSGDIAPSNSAGGIEETACRIIESAAGSPAHIPVDLLDAAYLGGKAASRPGLPARRGAQGIAQFMPRHGRGAGSCSTRSIPEQAIPQGGHAARRFGSAVWQYRPPAVAAYNAGSNSVADWLGAKGSLPAETQDYVLSVTGSDGRRLGRGQAGNRAYRRAERFTVMHRDHRRPSHRKRAPGSVTLGAMGAFSFSGNFSK